MSKVTRVWAVEAHTSTGYNVLKYYVTGDNIIQASDEAQRVLRDPAYAVTKLERLSEKLCYDGELGR